jgi:hypothetical protein
MQQSQSSVLPEIADKWKRPAGSSRFTGVTGLAGVALVAASVAMMASAAPAYPYTPAHAHPASVPAHPSALVKVRAS